MKALGHGFTVLMILSAAACGEPAGDDDGNGNGPTPTPVSAEKVQKAGGTISSGAEFGAKSYDLRANPGFSGCPTVTSIMGDSDGDGIHDAAGMEYTSCAVQSAWGAATLNGDAFITDSEPNVPGVDATLAQDFVFAVTGTAGVIVDFQVVQELSLDGSAYVFNEPSVVTESTATSAYKQQNAWSKRYDPDSAWQPGDALVAGSYEVNGAFRHTNTENGAITYELEGVIATEVPLRLEPACASLVVSGTLHAIIGNDQTGHQILEITWTGCDASNTDLIPAP